MKIYNYFLKKNAMVADVPLLSSYKHSFVVRRFIHTLTGVKVLRGNVPAFVPIIQVIYRTYNIPHFR